MNHLSSTATVKRDQRRPRPWRAVHDDSKDHTRFCKGPSAGQCSLLTSHDPGRAAGSWPCVSVTKAQPPSPSSLSSPSDGPCLGYPLPNLHPRCTPGPLLPPRLTRGLVLCAGSWPRDTCAARSGPLPLLGRDRMGGLCLRCRYSPRAQHTAGTPRLPHELVSEE